MQTSVRLQKSSSRGRNELISKIGAPQISARRNSNSQSAYQPQKQFDVQQGHKLASRRRSAKDQKSPRTPRSQPNRIRSKTHSTDTESDYSSENTPTSTPPPSVTFTHRGNRQRQKQLQNQKRRVRGAQVPNFDHEDEQIYLPDGGPGVPQPPPKRSQSLTSMLHASQTTAPRFTPAYGGATKSAVGYRSLGPQRLQHSQLGRANPFDKPVLSSAFQSDHNAIPVQQIQRESDPTYGSSAFNAHFGGLSLDKPLLRQPILDRGATQPLPSAKSLMKPRLYSDSVSGPPSLKYQRSTPDKVTQKVRAKFEKELADEPLTSPLEQLQLMLTQPDFNAKPTPAPIYVEPHSNFKIRLALVPLLTAISACLEDLCVDSVLNLGPGGPKRRRVGCWPALLGQPCSKQADDQPDIPEMRGVDCCVGDGPMRFECKKSDLDFNVNIFESAPTEHLIEFQSVVGCCKTFCQIFKEVKSALLGIQPKSEASSPDVPNIPEDKSGASIDVLNEMARSKVLEDQMQGIELLAKLSEKESNRIPMLKQGVLKSLSACLGQDRSVHVQQLAARTLTNLLTANHESLKQYNMGKLATTLAVLLLMSNTAGSVRDLGLALNSMVKTGNVKLDRPDLVHKWSDLISVLGQTRDPIARRCRDELACQVYPGAGLFVN